MPSYYEQNKHRDFLAHNYETIVTRYVWDAVKDVPNLRAAVVSLLASLPSDDDDGT